MSMRYKGGVLSATAPTTSSSSATGVWTMRQQLQAIGGTGWPYFTANYIAFLSGASGTNNSSRTIVTDTSGNMYICGQSQNASFTSYAAVAKYDSSGTYQWQKTLSNTVSSFNGSTVDSSGNVYAIGNLQVSGVSRLGIVKFNSTGSVLWARYLYSTDDIVGNSVILDSSDNVYVTGTVSTSATLDNIIIAKYSSSGTIQWQRVLRGTNNDSGLGVAVDSSSNVYVVGETYNPGYPQLILAKYNSSGAIQWQKVLGAGTSGNGARGASIKIDASDNIYVTGYNTVSANIQILIVKYNTSGVVQWQRYIGTGSGQSISTDTLGNVYVAGIGGGSNSGTMVKYNSSGTIQWQRKIGATSASSNSGIYISSNNTMYVAGRNDNLGTTDWLFEALPIDGSKTGTYTVNGISITYAAGSMTAGTPTLPEATATLTDVAGTLTDASFTPSIISNNLTSSVTTI